MNFAKIMQETSRFFQSCLSSDGEEILYNNYGLTKETIFKAGVGYAPKNREQLFTHLTSKGFKPYDLYRTGLFYGRIALWGGRIMFPYHENGLVVYFIGREIEGVTSDENSGKYVKQMTGSLKHPTILAKEPIFGIDTIQPGETLIITEGIADAIICHQMKYATISPVTVRFKGGAVDETINTIRSAGKIVIIMDNEDNGAGLDGAADTAILLGSMGITCFIGEIPRPLNVSKIDLNDFVREGGCLEQLISSAILAEYHPLVKEKRRDLWKIGTDKLISHITIRKIEKRRIRDKSEPSMQEKTDIVKRYLPSLYSLTGIENGLGPHPILGSTTGNNLSVHNGVWHCFRPGHRGGGDVLQWIAVYELDLIKEGEKLRGEAFIKTVNYCWDHFVPEHERWNCVNNCIEQKGGM